MNTARFLSFVILFFSSMISVNGQSMHIQTGALVERTTNTRLVNVQIKNKRSLATVRSDALGLYNIMALKGDTLEVSDNLYQTTHLVVDDSIFTKSTLEPWLILKEVIIKGTSLKANLDEVQAQYKSQGVFYTGNPHYYYLFLKPMTFIYENFKKEVKNARRFKKYADEEMNYNKITQRFNDVTIRNLLKIKDAELVSFKIEYMPSSEQMDLWSDYDLNRYIIESYKNFKKRH